MNSQRRRSALRRCFTSLRIEALEPRLALAAVAGSPSLLADLNPNGGSSNPSAPVVVGNVAYFAANDGTHGVELWKTDGTPGGTTLVKDIQPGEGSSNPRSLTAFHGKLYFQADDGVNGDELWQSDGTENGTQRVTDLAAGTASSFPDHMLVANDRLFFTAADSGFSAYYGPLPYLSAADSPFDQSKLGTDFWLEDFEDGKLNTPGVSADYGFVLGPGSLTDSVDADDGQIDGSGLNGHSYLVRPAMTGVTFTFDRTVLGGLPSQVGIVLTGGGEDTPGVNVDFYDAGGNLIGTINDMTPRPISGVTSDDRFIGFYHQTGISAMRISGPLGSANAGIEMDHLQYGSIVQPMGDMGLWYLDTTGAGPFKICDLGYQPSFSMANVNGALYFTGSDPATGIEVWKYANNDFSRVTDINPGPASSNPRSLTAVNDSLYFVADDGTHGRELWKLDSTGPSLVKDINPGTADAGITSLAILNGLLLFSANDGTDGAELWRSDGTTGGTTLAKDIKPGSDSSSPAQFVNVNGTLFFSADDGPHFVELWKTDGTPDGTQMVKDIAPGDHSSGLHSLTNIDGTLFFTAANGQGPGLELWQSDGTADGTTLVADINPTGSSAPRNLTIVNKHLVFEANDGTHGWELFTAPLSDFQYAAVEDTVLTVDAAHGLLTQASGLPGIPVAAALDTGPLHGTVNVVSDGSFTYQPDKDFNGLDDFTYKITDGQNNSAIATVTLDVKAVNDAPSFTGGPDVTVSDELAAAEQTTTIGFDDLTGAPDNLFYNYTQGDFKVTAVAGRWIEAHDPSHITGHPAPAIYSDSYNGTLEIKRNSGGTFAISSFDLASWEFDFFATNSPVQYTIEGYLNGQLLYSKTGQVSTSDFTNIDGLPGALVDTVRFNMVRVDSRAYILDNIRLVTETGSSPDAWATNIVAGPPDESSQGLNFVVTTDKPELFVVQPAIDASGHLTFVPKANVEGVATVSVALHDDGGTALGGVDTSPTQSFKIDVVKQHRWHNVVNSNDVDGDGLITASDAIAVINYINAGRPGDISGSQIGKPYGFLDVDANDSVTASDVIDIINAINAAPRAPSATFVAADTSTQGSWIGKYGNGGYALNSGPSSLPAYAEMSFKSGLTDIYDNVDAASTSDPRALQIPGSADRLAAEWTGDYGFMLDLNLQSGQAHRVALYMLDWNTTSRNQRLDVIDANTGALLDTQTIQSFHGGTYLVWNITGHVKIRFSNLANGLNAVLSGVFFD